MTLEWLRVYISLFISHPSERDPVEGGKNLLWKQKLLSERGSRKKKSNYVTEYKHTVQIREGGMPDGCLFDSLSINLVPAEKHRANLEEGMKELLGEPL